MTWWAIEVNTAPESRVRLGAWLVEQTGHAVEERDDGTLVAYAGTTEAAGMLDRALRGFAESPVTVVHRVVPEVDWSTSLAGRDHRARSSAGSRCRRRGSPTRRGTARA